MSQTLRAAAPLDPQAVDDLLIVQDGEVLYRVLVYPAAQQSRREAVEVVPTTPPPLSLVP